MHVLCRDDYTLKVRYSPHEVFHWLKTARMVTQVVLCETRAIGIVHLLIRDRLLLIPGGDTLVISLHWKKISIAPPPLLPLYTLLVTTDPSPLRSPKNHVILPKHTLLLFPLPR